MIDIHTHIIPGIDDGARDMETSILMAEMAVESGVDTIIATPHCNQRGLFENYMSDSLIRRMDRFRDKIAQENIKLKIGYGMEIFCTREVPELLRRKKLISLNDSRYVLVEFNFRIEYPRLERMLFSIMEIGYVPIIAHPERYTDLHGRFENIKDWLGEGMGIQVNKGSIFGHFGRDARDFALRLLRNGLVTCIASDAHGIGSRTTDMSMIFEFLSTEFSEKEAHRLLTENPGRIYNDELLLSRDDIQSF